MIEKEVEMGGRKKNPQISEGHRGLNLLSLWVVGVKPRLFRLCGEPLFSYFLSGLVSHLYLVF